MRTQGQRQFRQAAKALLKAAKEYEATGKALTAAATAWARCLDTAALRKAPLWIRALARAARAHAKARQRLEQCLDSAPSRRRIGSRSLRPARRSNA